MKSRGKCRLHFRYSLVWILHIKAVSRNLTFFHHASSWNYNLKLTCSLQFGTPASLNTEAYTERRGKNRLRYSLTTSMSVTLLLTVFFLIKVPSKPNAKPMAIKRYWISPWGRSGVDHKGIHFNTTDCYFLYTFLVVRFVSFRSFLFWSFQLTRPFV